MLNRNVKLSAIVIIAALSLAGCQKHKNPLLKDIKASSKIQESVLIENTEAFNAISMDVSWEQCVSTVASIKKKYGSKSAAYQKVCKHYLKGLLTKAHQNPLFKTATIADFYSLKFQKASSEEQTREFVR